MLNIDCPWCGPRDEIEFRCSGESRPDRPADPQATSDLAWGRYLYEKANDREKHLERWVHAYGCRQWFYVARHTGTHAIGGVYRIGAVPSDSSSATGAT